jgi:diadenosine tetraphosphate (Ap4A) HIT family hydrolase
MLLCKKHLREPYELPHDEQHLFFEDMMRVGRALESVFAPVKMNFEMLGNSVPHLHCHIKPRYYGDPPVAFPFGPISIPQHSLGGSMRSA